jgi:hypothetical protein
VLFVYARPEHTQRTLLALEANDLADRTDIYIFADAPRAGHERGAQAVRQVVSRSWKFRSKHVTYRRANLGLADNIISGLGEVMARHGRAIVLEDDIVTSPRFLSFMNECLVRYRGEKAIWHINGWTCPVAHNADHRAYFTPLMECWGWAKWQVRWQSLRRYPKCMLG